MNQSKTTQRPRPGRSVPDKKPLVFDGNKSVRIDYAGQPAFHLMRHHSLSGARGLYVVAVPLRGVAGAAIYDLQGLTVGVLRWLRMISAARRGRGAKVDVFLLGNIFASKGDGKPVMDADAANRKMQTVCSQVQIGMPGNIAIAASAVFDFRKNKQVSANFLSHLKRKHDEMLLGPPPSAGSIGSTAATAVAAEQRAGEGRERASRDARSTSPSFAGAAEQSEDTAVVDFGKEPGICKYIRAAMKELEKRRSRAELPPQKWVRTRTLRYWTVTVITEDLEPRQKPMANAVLTDAIWELGLRHLSGDRNEFWWLETTPRRDWVVLDSAWLLNKVFGESLVPEEISARSCFTPIMAMKDIATRFDVAINATQAAEADDDDAEAVDELLVGLGLAHKLSDGRFFFPARLRPHADEEDLAVDLNADRSTYPFFIGRTFRGRVARTALPPGSLSTLMVRALERSGDPDFFGNASLTSFRWADGPAVALVEEILDARDEFFTQIRVRVWGREPASHTTLAKQTRNLIHGVRSDICPEVELEQILTWRSGVSVAEAQIGEMQIVKGYVALGGGDVPLAALLTGEREVPYDEAQRTEGANALRTEVERLHVGFDNNQTEYIRALLKPLADNAVRCEEIIRLQREMLNILKDDGRDLPCTPLLLPRKVAKPLQDLLKARTPGRWTEASRRMKEKVPAMLSKEYYLFFGPCLGQNRRNQRRQRVQSVAADSVRSKVSETFPSAHGPRALQCGRRWRTGGPWSGGRRAG